MDMGAARVAGAPPAAPNWSTNGSTALVLVGDQFGAFAIQMARKIADALPGATFRVLPGGCDPSNLVVPDQFDQAVLHFLGATA
jgi:hypothetical protein